VNQVAGVIDTDPEILRRSAEASLHAASEAWTHIRAEFAAADGDYDKLMATLRLTGPYGYTIQPHIGDDGSVRAPVLTTRTEIRNAYGEVRGRSDLLSSEPLVEVRGTWYTFHESVNIAQIKGAEPSHGAHVLAMFPVGSGQGITGELVWPWAPPHRLGRDRSSPPAPDNPLEARRALLKLHDRYLEAFAAEDADALVATMDTDVQSGVRDYVHDTGTLVELVDREETRSHYAELFHRYKIDSFELLERVVQEWYVFFEVRVTVTPRQSPQDRIAFHLAEYFVTSRDGRFIVRIGHGTDPATVA
jgi:hypothetical protein